MAINPVNNNISGVNFTSHNDEKASMAREKAVAFVNMDDAQLKNLAYVASYDKKHKKSHNSDLLALPVIAGISRGILTEGKLSTRAVAATKSAASWGGALVILGIYNGVKNAIVSKSSKLQELQANNPLMSMLVDLGLFAGALALGSKGINKIAPKIANKLPKTMEAITKKINTAKIWLDKSIANTKVLPKITKLVNKLAKTAPWAVGAGKFAIANAVIIALFAGIMKNSNKARQQNEKIADNYYKLKEAQVQVAQSLANEINS